MAMVDSMDKIITRYFYIITKEEFLYKGKVYEPKPLKVSPLLLRDYTCPPMCGACCARFSLDYLPGEDMPEQAEKRPVEFNNKYFIIYSDKQDDHKDYHCRNLIKENGRCGIYEYRPFSCDFELIRPLEFMSKNTPNVLTQKLFGRGWAMKRIDGERGNLCEMTPVTEHSIDEVIRKMRRLEDWCDYFELDNKCQDIIDWIMRIRPFINYKKIKPVII